MSWSGDDVVRALGRAGFRHDRQRGSHRVLRHPDGRTVTIPMHKEIRRGTLGSICRQAGLTMAELEALR